MTLIYLPETFEPRSRWSKIWFGKLYSYIFIYIYITYCTNIFYQYQTLFSCIDNWILIHLMLYMYNYYSHTQNLSNIDLVHLTPRTLPPPAETDRRCDTPWNDLSKAGTFLVPTGVWKRRVSRGGKQNEPQLPPETKCLLNYFKGSIYCAI